MLGGGVLWYERSRPPAKVVALVAALAALAVAGRLALAPIPNVVATTDIVLISGYALGGPPGFAVGALAALVSNFWLGQGPWTPWQMAGWGLVGIGGAALGAASDRRLGRIGLAAACGFAGLAYGALLDLSVMVTYGGEQSLDRYLALSARGIPFNLAHALGNVAFALIAGPALARMLLRFRSRLEVSWSETLPAPAAGAAAALILAVCMLASAAEAPNGRARAGPGSDPVSAPAALEALARSRGGDAAAARRWLERAQNRDGGFPAEPGDDSSVAMTNWALLGLEAARRNPADLRRGGRSAIDYLRAKASTIRSATDLERTILTLRGAGVRAADFAGRDLVAELAERRRPNGSFQGQVNITAFGALALRAGGKPASAVGRSTGWLRRAQNDDGGWGFAPRSPSDADSTGAALQALAAGGAGSGGTAHDAVVYLRRTQRGDGGWALAGGGPTNSQSTAWAIQGMLAAGADPGGRAFHYLRARQSGDGHYRYSSSSDQTPVWVTGQALLAATGSPFPLAAVPRAGRPGGLDALPADGAGGGGSGIVGAPAAPGGSGSERSRAAGGGPVAEPGGKANRRADSGRRERGPEPTRERGGGAGPTALAEAAAAVPAGESGSGDSDLVAYLAAGFALLALGLAGGFLWYRRRLP